MHYSINVARKGQHLFATSDHSLRSEPAAEALYNEFKKVFPDCSIEVTMWKETGKQIIFDEVKK